MNDLPNPAHLDSLQLAHSASRRLTAVNHCRGRDRSLDGCSPRHFKKAGADAISQSPSVRRDRIVENYASSLTTKRSKASFLVR